MRVSCRVGASLAVVLAVALCGCSTSPKHTPPPDVGTAGEQPLLLGSAGQATAAQVEDAARGLGRDATAQQIADLLTAIGAARVPHQDLAAVSRIEADLLSRLRARVTSEVSSLHEQALRSPSYREGYDTAQQAAGALALFPLSDTPATMKEASDLSLRQGTVMRRLDLIRRQRYNHWAAGQAEKALKELRSHGKEGVDKAISHLSPIEPTMLESSVAGLYSYAVNEIMDVVKKDEKAAVAKKLTSPSITRRGVEDF